jgi:hypothetical protein
MRTVFPHSAFRNALPGTAEHYAVNTTTIIGKINLPEVL